MRTDWRDGGRTRTVEVAAQGSGRYRVIVDGAVLDLEVERLGGGRLRLKNGDALVAAVVTATGDRRFVRIGRLDFVLERLARGAGRRAGAGGQGGLEAPMPGVVTRVLVSPGDSVRKGQPLVAIEAMKMEHMIRAPHDGRVKGITAAPGDMVSGGVALVELEEPAG